MKVVFSKLRKTFNIWLTFYSSEGNSLNNFCMLKYKITKIKIKPFPLLKTFHESDRKAKKNYILLTFYSFEKQFYMLRSKIATKNECMIQTITKSHWSIM